MILNISDEAKAFLKEAIRAGEVYTCPIFPIGVIYHQAIKEVSIAMPYGKPCVRKHVSFFSTLLAIIIVGVGGIL